MLIYQLKKLMLSVAFLLLTINAVSAAEITINLNEASCSVSFISTSGGACDANQCQGDATCICAQKKDFISWRLNNEEKFKLKFNGNTPLKDNCGKNYKKSPHRCKVKEDVNVGDSFTYDIKLEKCANGTDPRIVIRPPSD